MGVLAGGTLAAQLIALAATPLLGRVFTPAEFGVLGIVNAVALPIVAVAALRYDMAIVLPKDDARAADVAALATLACIGTAALTLGAVAVARVPIAELVGAPSLAGWLWICPVVVLVGGLHGVASLWATRRKAFRPMSEAAVLASTVTVGGQGAAGLAGAGAGGLIWGAVAGRLLGIARLLFRAELGAAWRAVSLAGVKEGAREYDDFPRLQLPAGLLNHVTQHLPVYGLGLFFGGDEVGQWTFAVMILSAPVHLLSGAVRQVALQDASERLHRGEALGRPLARTTGALALLGLVPTAIGVAIAPVAFVAILGDAWVEAGEHARWILVWQLTVLINAPTAAVYPVLRLNRMILLWQIGSFLLAAGALWLGRAAPSELALAYCAAMSLSNLAIAALVHRAAVARGGAGALRDGRPRGEGPSGSPPPPPPAS